jgi:hypothetical protein
MKPKQQTASLENMAQFIRPRVPAFADYHHHFWLNLLLPLPILQQLSDESMKLFIWQATGFCYKVVNSSESDGFQHWLGGRVIPPWNEKHALGKGMALVRVPDS